MLEGYFNNLSCFNIVFMCYTILLYMINLYLAQQLYISICNM